MISSKVNSACVAVILFINLCNALFSCIVSTKPSLLPFKSFNTFTEGVAEQNMATIAAGMASYGMLPIINTFSAFASRRICDQIAVSICYANQNVKIIGTDPGITAAFNGGTHMAIEDIGVLRSIPNITIVEPSDACELEQAIPAIINYEGPVYLRMTRNKTEDIHGESYKFRLGKADIIREGKDVTIICSGIMVHEALKAADELKKQDIDAEIINLHTIKPIDTDTILRSVRKTGVIVTAENHNIIGGLRAAVAEVITLYYPVKIFPVGINDKKGEVGRIDYLMKKFQLTYENIISAVEKALS